MSKFRRKSPKAVRRAVTYKADIRDIIAMKKFIVEMNEENKRNEMEMLEVGERIDASHREFIAACERDRLDNDSASCLYVSQKYLFLASILVTASISLLIGVISNAP